MGNTSQHGFVLPTMITLVQCNLQANKSTLCPLNQDTAFLALRSELGFRPLVGLKDLGLKHICNYSWLEKSELGVLGHILASSSALVQTKRLASQPARVLLAETDWLDGPHQPSLFCSMLPNMISSVQCNLASRSTRALASRYGFPWLERQLAGNI